MERRNRKHNNKEEGKRGADPRLGIGRQYLSQQLLRIDGDTCSLLGDRSHQQRRREQPQRSRVVEQEKSQWCSMAFTQAPRECRVSVIGKGEREKQAKDRGLRKQREQQQVAGYEDSLQGCQTHEQAKAAPPTEH